VRRDASFWVIVVLSIATLVAFAIAIREAW